MITRSCCGSGYQALHHIHPYPQVVVADSYYEWDREEKANQKESPRRNEAPTTDNNSVRLQVRNTGHQQTTCKCQY